LTPARRRILDYALAGLLLLLPAALLHANMKEPERRGPIDRTVLFLATPVQVAVTWLIESTGDLWTSYVWLVRTEADNQALRADNDRLRHKLAEAERRALDTGALEELIGLRRELAAETVGARVIAASLNPHFRVTRIRIDRGAGEVAPGMPVISPEGLVGRVHQVSGSVADVMLTTDARSSIDVYIPRTGGRGVLTGLGLDHRYGAEIEYLEHGQEVAPGDLVVTSGLGEAFPRGITVGTVTSVTPIEYGLYQEVEVEPAVEFGALSRVLVIRAPPPSSDPQAGQRAPVRAHGVEPF
jgi:rod shape-determining protein MreC